MTDHLLKDVIAVREELRGRTIAGWEIVADKQTAAADELIAAALSLTLERRTAADRPGPGETT